MVGGGPRYIVLLQKRVATKNRPQTQTTVTALKRGVHCSGGPRLGASDRDYFGSSGRISFGSPSRFTSFDHVEGKEVGDRSLN